MKKLDKGRLYNVLIIVCIIAIMVGSFAMGWISRGMTTTNAVPHNRKVVIRALKKKTLHWNDVKGWCWI